MKRQWAFPTCQIRRLGIGHSGGCDRDLVVFELSVANDPSEDTLGDEVKNSVDDGFTSDTKRAGTFGEDPNDGVHEPGDDGEVSDDTVGVVEPEEGKDLALVGGETGKGIEECCVDDLVAEDADVVQDGDEGKDGEAEEDPLLAAADGGGDAARDDHDDVGEEEEVPDLVGGVTEVAEGVEHEGGGDYPVDVTSVEEHAAVAAASVPAVAGGHGEVGKRGDQANASSNEGRVGKEVEDGRVNGCELTINHAISGIGDGKVPPEHLEVVAGEDEEDGETHPKDDGASALDVHVAGVDGATGARGEFRSGLELAVARSLGLSFAAVGLLGTVGFLGLRVFLVVLCFD